jgi:sugar lactone lactonase YvrE
MMFGTRLENIVRSLGNFQRLKKLNTMRSLVAACGLINILAVFMVNGCAPVRSVPELPQTKVELVWPSPPEIPRIKYLASIATPTDLGVTKSFFRRVWEFFVGEEEENIVKPYGIHTDQEERIYVVDSSARVVHVFDRKGQSYRRIGDPKKLKFPIDVAIGPKGQILVSDAELGVVLQFDSDGTLLKEIGAGYLTRPAGIAYNPKNGLLYVVDVSQHQVLAFDPQGQVRHRVGRRGEANGEFNFPTNITVDKGGFLYVTDSLNFRVQIFDSEGNFVAKFGQAGDALGYFSKPKGVALDSEGHIYVVEGLYDTVLIFDQKGRLLLNFGNAGAGAGQFWLATGIFIDAQDRIYVADSYNQRIQLFQYLKAGAETKR